MTIEIENFVARGRAAQEAVNRAIDPALPDAKVADMESLTGKARRLQARATELLGELNKARGELRQVQKEIVATAMDSNGRLFPQEPPAPPDKAVTEVVGAGAFIKVEHVPHVLRVVGVHGPYASGYALMTVRADATPVKTDPVPEYKSTDLFWVTEVRADGGKLVSRDGRRVDVVGGLRVAEDKPAAAAPAREQRMLLTIEPAGGEARSLLVIQDAAPPEDDRPIPQEELDALGEGAEHPLPQIPPLNEMKGGRESTVKPPADRDADPDIEPGRYYTREELGVHLDWLEQCILTNRILPPAPDFKGEGGKIDSVTRLGGRPYTAVTCEVLAHEVVYRLQPLVKLHEAGPMAVNEWQSLKGQAVDAAELGDLLVADAHGQEWVFEDNAQSIFVKVPIAAMGDRLKSGPRIWSQRPPRVADPDAPNLFPQIYPDSKKDDADWAREWYRLWSDEYSSPTPLNEGRLRTIMDLPTWCRHLMLDPKLNDSGVRASPDRKRVHTIPKNVGTAEICLYEDIDGKHWASSSFDFKLQSLGGGSAFPGLRRDSKPSDRYDTAYDALLGELASLQERHQRRLLGRSEGEKAALRRFNEGLTKFRAQAKQVFEKSTAVVKHTPGPAEREVPPEHAEAVARKFNKKLGQDIRRAAKEPESTPVPAGRRGQSGGKGGVTFFQWFATFKAVYEQEARNAGPNMPVARAEDPRIHELFGLYPATRPADAARRFAKEAAAERDRQSSKKGR